MKWTLQTFALIFSFLAVVYVIASFNQGNFDMSVWTETVKETVTTVSTVGSIFIFFVRFISIFI